jgi:amphi-Trp domain-containing protein
VASRPEITTSVDVPPRHTAGISLTLRIVHVLFEHCRVLARMGELETEEQKTRAEIATYLRGLADQLDGDGDVALDLGGTTVQLNPTNPITFKLEGESDWSQGDTEAKQSIEFELVWWRDAATVEEGTLDVHE